MAILLVKVSGVAILEKSLKVKKRSTWRRSGKLIPSSADFRRINPGMTKFELFFIQRRCQAAAKSRAESPEFSNPG
jgi:hypothetical protein